MSNWLQRTGTAVTLSTVTLLLFLERIALDFRYVSLEFEAVDAVMPFTAPYVVVSFVIFGAWIWGLLAAVQGRRGGLIAMLACNLIALALGVSTVLFLCPTPCQTGAPLADIIDWGIVAVGLTAIVSAGMAFWGRRSLQAARQG
jgi:hypothetical protein